MDFLKSGKKNKSRLFEDDDGTGVIIDNETQTTLIDAVTGALTYKSRSQKEVAYSCMITLSNDTGRKVIAFLDLMNTPHLMYKRKKNGYPRTIKMVDIVNVLAGLDDALNIATLPIMKRLEEQVDSRSFFGEKSVGLREFRTVQDDKTGLSCRVHIAPNEFEKLKAMLNELKEKESIPNAFRESTLASYLLDILATRVFLVIEDWGK